MSRLRVLSLNVCFEVPETFNRRFGALCAHIKAELYDVVCLQESVDELFDKLDQRLRDLYWVSPRPASAPYYTLMLCRRGLFGAREPQPKFERLRLPSRMGRDLLLVDIPRAGGNVLTCATTHLESEDSHPVREQQMRRIHELLKGKSDVVLTGDFNFGAHRNYRAPWTPLHNDSLAACLPGYVDGWVAKHGKDSGFTFMHERNQWKFSDKSNARGGFRFDRVMLKLKPHPFTFTSINKVCDVPIGTRGGEIESPLYMSDHIGLSVAIADGNEAPAAQTSAVSSNSHSEGQRGTRKRDLVEEEDEEVEIIEPSEASKLRKRTKLDDTQAEKPMNAHVAQSASISDHMSNVETFLGEEPPLGPGVITVALKMPSGKRFQRRFHISSGVESLYWWACSLDPSLFEKHDFGLKFDSFAATAPFDFGNVQDIPKATLDLVPGLDRATLRIVLGK